MSGEVNMIQTLRKFRGGQTKQIWGGQSRDIFRGGPVKKITLYYTSEISIPILICKQCKEPFLSRFDLRDHKQIKHGDFISCTCVWNYFEKYMVCNVYFFNFSFSFMHDQSEGQANQT